MRSIAVTFFMLVAWLPCSSAHYHMLIPNKPSVKTGDEIAVVYQFGHPFEHEIADVMEPIATLVHLPDGKVLDVKSKLRKIEIAGGNARKHVGFQLTYKPEHRGDHILVFSAPPVMHEGERIPVRDTIKLVIHVQTENGWDSRAAISKDQHADLVPLMRSFWLRAGMLFRAAFHDLESRPAAASIGGATVEIERFNSEPPKDVPTDEHITYSARTDDKGVVATTLPDPGWWAITAIHPTPRSIHRCTLWVHVDGKIPLKPAD